MPASTNNDYGIRTTNDNLHRESSHPFYASILQCSFMPSITRQMPQIYNLIADKNTPHFRRILIDTGAARGSTDSLLQYLVYWDHVGCRPMIDNTRPTMIHFGNGSEKSQSTALISFPIGSIAITFAVHILKEADVLLITGTEDMDHWGIYYNNISDRLIHPETGQFAHVVREGQHAFVTWNPPTKCYYTTSELKRLRRCFGYPNTNKLMNLLGKADLDAVDKETQKTLQHTADLCDACQELSLNVAALNSLFVWHPISQHYLCW